MTAHTYKERVKNALIELGKFLSQFGPSTIEKKEGIRGNDLFFEPMKMVIERAGEKNPWFTPRQIGLAMQNWARALTPEKVEKWLEKYPLDPPARPKKVGIIMAGNIPLVGLHDLLSVLASGHKPLVKMSSQDNMLIPMIVKYLEHVNPEWKGRTEFREGLMKDMDAVIATGSDNSARYFEYYFDKYPHIIRKNRNGVAVLTGEETPEELEGLAADMLDYYGLGCRNVSKIYVPRGYDLNNIFQASLRYSDYVNDQKYMNNYRYNKALFVMGTDEESRRSLRDNGLILFKKDPGYASPVGTVFYEYYDDLEDVKKILEHDKDKIQVIVSKADVPGAIPFGTTQQPELWDYADGVDTMAFLQGINDYD
ncbi:MAG: acyl-CoA reductase [Chlorobi bacterium]|nr:acyl-CoA reductase [Chlorobiota bacterium]